MQVFIILSCLFLGTLGQTQPAWFQHVADYINNIDDTIDIVHNTRVEYHHDGKQHLLIAIEDRGRHRSCTFIEISPVWEPLLKDAAKVTQISEEISHVIHAHDEDGQQVVSLTMDQVMAAYGDMEVKTECAGHQLRTVSYTPSAAIMSS